MVKQATCFFKVFLCKPFVQNLCLITKQHFFSLLKRTKPSFIKMSNPFKKPFLAVFGQKMVFSEMIIYSSFIFYFPVASLFRFWPKIVLFDFFEKRCACVDRTPRFCVAVINAQLRCHLFLRNVKNAPFVWSAIFGISSVFQNEANYRFFLTFDQKWSFLL